LVYKPGHEPKRTLGNYQNVEVRRLDSVEIVFENVEISNLAEPCFESLPVRAHVVVRGDFLLENFLHVTHLEIEATDIPDAVDILTEIAKGAARP
jgi:hypothetical protein